MKIYNKILERKNEILFLLYGLISGLYIEHNFEKGKVYEGIGVLFFVFLTFLFYLIRKKK